MKTTPHFLMVTIAAVLVGGCMHAQAQQRLAAIVQRVADSGTSADASQVEFSGTVTDSAGKPVSGATVEYWHYERLGFRPSEPDLEKQLTTGADGVFAIQVSRDQGFL